MGPGPAGGSGDGNEKPVGVPESFHDDYATGWIDSTIIYTTIHLYADGHSGGGGSWGLGLGAGNLEGNLSHYSWWMLCSAKNGLYVESISDGVAMEFTIGGDIVATFVGGNLGALVAAGFSGSMEWS